MGNNQLLILIAVIFSIWGLGTAIVHSARWVSMMFSIGRNYDRKSESAQFDYKSQFDKYDKLVDDMNNHRIHRHITESHIFRNIRGRK